MNRQIFFDPQRKRWKRLRRILDAVAVFSTIILVLFFLNVLKTQHLPELLLPTPKRNYRAIQEQAAAIKAKYLKPARRKTSRKASEIPFNTGEGLRAAYYLPDNEASYSSFKEHVSQIDILFPVWLHVSEPDGNLMGESSDDRERMIWRQSADAEIKKAPRSSYDLSWGEGTTIIRVYDGCPLRLGLVFLFLGFSGNLSSFFLPFLS